MGFRKIDAATRVAAASEALEGEPVSEVARRYGVSEQSVRNWAESVLGQRKRLRAQIGDVRRFERKQSLVAFAGIDPMPNQSGEKNVRSNKSSKRGSPYLRKALFNVMTCYLQKAPADEPLFQFLDRKRAVGKPYYVYMTAGANKFLRRYYGKVMEYLSSLENLPPVDMDSTGLPKHP